MVLAGALIALDHIARSSWSEVVDAAVTPEEGGPLGPVLDGRVPWFPDGLIYAVSRFVAGGPRGAAVLYAGIMLVLLYVLLRLCARFLAWHDRHRFLEIAMALVATGVFGVFVLLEPEPDIDRTSIATLFLLPGYPGGVVLVGLAIVAMVLWASHAFTGVRSSRRRVTAFVAVAGLVTACAASCDGLILSEVVAPVVATAAILWFAARIDLRLFAAVAGALVVGAVVGRMLRPLLGGSRADGPARSVDRVPDGVDGIERTIGALAATPHGSMNLIVVAILVALGVGALVFGLFGQSRPRLRNRLDAADFFVGGFVAISTLGLLASAATTGGSATRDLLPLYAFPLLALIAVGVQIMRRLLLSVESAELRANLARASTGFAAVIAVLIVAVGVSGLPRVIELVAA